MTAFRDEIISNTTINSSTLSQLSDSELVCLMYDVGSFGSNYNSNDIEIVITENLGVTPNTGSSRSRSSASTSGRVNRSRSNQRSNRPTSNRRTTASNRSARRNRNTNVNHNIVRVHNTRQQHQRQNNTSRDQVAGDKRFLPDTGEGINKTPHWSRHRTNRRWCSPRSIQ